MTAWAWLFLTALVATVLALDRRPVRRPDLPDGWVQLAVTAVLGTTSCTFAAAGTSDAPLPGPWWLWAIIFSQGLIAYIMRHVIGPGWSSWRKSKIVMHYGRCRNEPNGGYGQPPEEVGTKIWTDVHEDEELGCVRAMVREWRPKRDRTWWITGKKNRWEEVAVLATYDQVMSEGKGHYLTEYDMPSYADTFSQGWHPHGRLMCAEIAHPFRRLTSVQLRPKMTPAGLWKRRFARATVAVLGGWAGLGTGALLLYLLWVIWGLWLAVEWLQALVAAAFVAACAVGWGKVWVPHHYARYDAAHPYFSKERGYIKKIVAPLVPFEEEVMVWAILVVAILIDDPDAPVTEENVARRSELARVTDRVAELRLALEDVRGDLEERRLELARLVKKGRHNNAERTGQIDELERVTIRTLEERESTLQADISKLEAEARRLRGEDLHMPGVVCDGSQGIPEGYRIVTLHEIKYYMELSERGQVRISPDVIRCDRNGLPLTQKRSIRSVLRAHYHPRTFEQFLEELADARAANSLLTEAMKSALKHNTERGSEVIQEVARIAQWTERTISESIPAVVDLYGGDVEYPTLRLEGAEKQEDS